MTKSIRSKHGRIGKTEQVANAISFQAKGLAHVEQAWPGDTIGLHRHGTIQIGDTFNEGEELNCTGIPYFAPKLFRRVVPEDHLL